MSETAVSGHVAHRRQECRQHETFGEPGGVVLRDDHTELMRLPGSSRRRLAIIAIGSALVLAACGGSDSTSEPAGSTLPPPPDVVELDPTADIAANQLPDVVVDDVIAGNKVNLRNMAPADTPILLWMYAPH